MLFSSFRGDMFFLSNFYEAKVEIEGLSYNNAESAFQAMKCKYYDDRIDFLSKTGQQAKARGKRVSIRPDWENVKDDYMYTVVKAKFTQNEELKKRLINTGDTLLVEHNSWGDEYWGVCEGIGQNKLGLILMQVREELKEM